MESKEINKSRDYDFDKIVEAYRNLIKLLTKKNSSPEISVLTNEEEKDLTKLKLVISSKDKDKKILRYKNSMNPEQHDQLQNLEARIHKLSNESE